MKKVAFVLAAAILVIAGCNTSTSPPLIRLELADNDWYQSDDGIDLWIIDIGETANLKIHIPDMEDGEWANVTTDRHTLHELLTTGEWCTMGKIFANPNLVGTPTDRYIKIEWDEVNARPRVIVYRRTP